MKTKYARLLFFVVASLLLLSGCATPTPYSPKGFTGGYEEQQIDENTYRVSFFGNGVTSQDKVWNFWIHRCAELTLQKGFAYFTLSKGVKTSELPDETIGRARFGRNDSGSLIKVRGGGGGGGGGGRGYVPQYYYYTPGPVITKYTGSAIVKMFHDPLPFEVPVAFKAKAVLQVLGPYVQTDGNIAVPTRDEIIRSTIYSRFGVPGPSNRAIAPIDETPGVTEDSVGGGDPVGQDPAKQVPRHAGDPNPQVGDTWTYRYSDGYGRTETYKVRLTSTSSDEIEDEIRIGHGRQALSFVPELELSSRSLSGLTVREFSPYLLSLGPTESDAAWNSIKLFKESQPFQGRFVGTELVSVPAGTFEAKKLVIEGTQFARTSHIAALSREYKITVWYAPAARRFVKMAISAPERGMMSSSLPAERDVIELLESTFSPPAGQPVGSEAKGQAL